MRIKKFLPLIPFVAIAAAIAGLFISRALVSISMIVLVAYAVVMSNPVTTFRSFYSDKILLTLWFVFIIYLVSGLNSTEDPAFLLERLRLKLPFLALPVGFAVFRKNFAPRIFYLLIYFFLLLVTITALLLTFQYILHYEKINNLYVEGRVMKTPFNHVRYSLMVSFAIFTGYYLLLKKFTFRYEWEKSLIAGCSVFLIFFLHLLAVRSGIVGFYLCLVYLIFNFIFRHRQLKTALVLSATIILLPVLMYALLPPVKAKVNYMKYDLAQLLLFNNASGLSDGGRIISIEKGMELFREHFWTGVGVGDLEQEMKLKLDAAPEHPRDELLPHNQFLFVGASAGIFGLLMFCFAIFLPLFNRKNINNVLFVCFYIIILSSFFTEATIEEQMGTAFYLLFFLLLYKYIQSEPA
jgi:O-antigen ligase